MKFGVRAISALAALFAWSCGDPVPPVPTASVAAVDPEVRGAILTAHDKAVAQPKNGQASGRLGMVLEANTLYTPAVLAYRRAILLISETRDHGSHLVTIPQLVERIGISNTLVLSLTFSPSTAELIDWGRGNTNGGTELNLMAPLVMAINAMRKNTPKALASMSGGEYGPFTREKGFEDRVAEVANHARNRYMLSFRPTDLTPGLHTIKVSLAENYGAHVVTRASYWAVNDAAADPVNAPAKAPGPGAAQPQP